MSLETPGSWVRSLTPAVFRSMVFIHYLEALTAPLFADASRAAGLITLLARPTLHATAYADPCHAKLLPLDRTFLDGIRSRAAVCIHEACRSRVPKPARRVAASC